MERPDYTTLTEERMEALVKSAVPEYQEAGQEIMLAALARVVDLKATVSAASLDAVTDVQVGDVLLAIEDEGEGRRSGWAKYPVERTVDPYYGASLVRVTKKTAKSIVVRPIQNPTRAHSSTGSGLDLADSYTGEHGGYTGETRWADSYKRYVINLGPREALVAAIQSHPKAARMEALIVECKAIADERDRREAIKRAEQEAKVPALQAQADTLNAAFGLDVAEVYKPYQATPTLRIKGWAKDVPREVLRLVLVGRVAEGLDKAKADEVLETLVQERKAA